MKNDATASLNLTKTCSRIQFDVLEMDKKPDENLYRGYDSAWMSLESV